MRKYIMSLGVIGILAGMLGINSCAPDYETEFEVKTLIVPDESLSPISFPLDGGESVALVETNVGLADWSASSNAGWLEVSKVEGKVTISAGNNDTYDIRVARVTIAYGYQSYSIDVTQTGKVPLLLIDGEREGVVKKVNAAESFISVTVNSNLNVDHILVPDTAAFVRLHSVTDAPGSGNEKIVTFKIDRNLNRYARYSTVTLQSSDNYGHTASLLVVQASAIFAEIPLTESMLSTNAQEPREGPISNLLDGNPNTFFHTVWSYSINEAHYFQVTLDNPIEGCIFWYQNRNTNGAKPIDVLILVSMDGENWSEMAHITEGLPTGPSSQYESAYLAAESPFTHFRFVVNRTDSGTAPTYFNMAEFRMFKVSE